MGLLHKHPQKPGQNSGGGRGRGAPYPNPGYNQGLPLHVFRDNMPMEEEKVPHLFAALAIINKIMDMVPNMDQGLIMVTTPVLGLISLTHWVLMIEGMITIIMSIPITAFSLYVIERVLWQTMIREIMHFNWGEEMVPPIWSTIQ